MEQLSAQLKQIAELCAEGTTVGLYLYFHAMQLHVQRVAIHAAGQTSVAIAMVA